MTVELKEIGNQTELSAVGNDAEVTTFDVFTERSYISQFQISEENEEVRHEDNA